MDGWGPGEGRCGVADFFFFLRGNIGLYSFIGTITGILIISGKETSQMWRPMGREAETLARS